MTQIYGNEYEHVDDRSRKRFVAPEKRPTSMKKYAACLVILGVVFALRKVFAGGKDAESYSVVFDAGSTGSRVHVFRFGPTLDLLTIGDGELSFFAQVKPGISSFKDDPAGAQDGISGLTKEWIE